MFVESGVVGLCVAWCDVLPPAAGPDVVDGHQADSCLDRWPPWQPFYDCHWLETLQWKTRVQSASLLMLRPDIWVAEVQIYPLIVYSSSRIIFITSLDKVKALSLDYLMSSFLNIFFGSDYKHNLEPLLSVWIL